jgi:hypothetical protein
MFVYVNVIENITAYFGENDMDFFLLNLLHSITAFEALHDIFIYFFILFAMYQYHGKLPYQKRNKASRFPFMLCFTLMTLYALSNVSHKEIRFMSAMFPLYGISTGLLVMKLSNLVPTKLGKMVFMRIVIFYVIARECMQTTP